MPAARAIEELLRSGGPLIPVGVLGVVAASVTALVAAILAVVQLARGTARPWALAVAGAGTALLVAGVACLVLAAEAARATEGGEDPGGPPSCSGPPA